MLPVLRVENLTIDFRSAARWANVVDDVSFDIHPGEAFGLVGESGCGKTTTAYALLGYRRPNSRIRAGRIRLMDDTDLLRLSKRGLRLVRGGRISLVPQNPTTALSPGMTIGRQIEEVLLVHRRAGTAAERQRRVRDLLEQVNLPDPDETARKYPHQMSGGQQQRVVIAMALACQPQLVVLDEPTTGLDVTTQAQILDLLARLQREHAMAMLYVTHDLSVVAALCNRVGVMYAGKLVEDAPVGVLFDTPRHPYTRGLIASIPAADEADERGGTRLQGILQRDQLPPGCRFAPRCPFALERCFSEPQTLVSVDQRHHAACWRHAEIAALAADADTPPVLTAALPADAAPLLTVERVRLGYPAPSGRPFAAPAYKVVVRDVSFTIHAGETYALVGESGSGKSTLASAAAGLLTPLDGDLHFNADDLTLPAHQRAAALRRDIQLVLQNPDASLNPRQRVDQIIGRPLEFFFGLAGTAKRDRIAQLLADVRLPASYADRYPDELSGGERQRVAIARALAAQPQLMLCDEILSALDVSVQASVIDLLRTLQDERGLSYLFISHDLAVVRSLAHRVGVLYRGELVEQGTVAEVYSPPYHPYTHVLLAAVPRLGRTLWIPPRPAADSAKTPACPFAARCPWKLGAICDEVTPPWQPVSATHGLRCHIPLTELRQIESVAHAAPPSPSLT